MNLLDRLVPRSVFGSAAVAVLLTALLATAGAALSAGLANYGWTLFLGVPFVLGVSSSLIHGYHRPQGFRSCFGVTLLSLLFSAVLLIALAVEGLICILMAAPIAILLALFGTLIGYLIQARPEARPSRRHILLALTAALPLLMGAEAAVRPEPPLDVVRSSVEIDAPPERVWEHVVSFCELPPPDEMIFRAGVAHPKRAEIRGRGAGAVRYCVFSTGRFVEPIEVWDEPRLLAFSVTAQPAPMEEWTPYPGIHPPHLDGTFHSKRGQFLLERLPGNRTRLEGTTWYTHRLWPASYWGLWSDWVLHTIHLRVLRHVKVLSERKEP